ncbi:hypothetical protein, partial [Phocaeicola plebeius]|uniref:hypothetical protein n=1 Tax=Phocaeicola plebeius TaxID=310297 RepID=UPI0022E298AC
FIGFTPQIITLTLKNLLSIDFINWHIIFFYKIINIFASKKHLKQNNKNFGYITNQINPKS